MKFPVSFYFVLLSLISISFGQSKEIEVSTFYAKVYVAPSTNANFIGLIQKGERYPIIATRDNWYHIRFKDAMGWIQFSQANIIDPQAEAAAAAAAAAAAVDAAKTDSIVPEGEVSEVDSGMELSAGGLDSSFSSDTSEASMATRPAVIQNRSTSPGSATVPVARTRPVTAAPRRVKAAPRSALPTVDRKESRLRSWFTQQNVPELPAAVNPNAQTDEPVRFFDVKFPSGVREFLDPGAPILGMTKRGQMLQLIGEGDSWCKVAFADTIGWVETKTGKIVDPTVQRSLDYTKIALFFGGAVVLLVLVIIVVTRLRSNPFIVSSDSSGVSKTVLIISRTSKSIQYSLTKGATSLDRCFTEVGYKVNYAKEGAAIKSTITDAQPDILMIDFLFDHSIISFMEKVCDSLGIAEKVMVITFNVPDPSVMEAGSVFRTMTFLGTSFSDRDVFKLITPMLEANLRQNIQKSSHSSAMAGNIGGGNLIEVLQFIEIGSKTGCLLIELDEPFAIICFKNGRINFAATVDKITGRDAIFKVLELKVGRFRFVLDKKPKESNVNLSTLEILMEWTKMIDEAHVN